MLLLQEIDDIAELNIIEDLNNRPSKKKELGVLEPKPMSPTMSGSSRNSECFESIVAESNIQIDRDPLASPPSSSSSTLSSVLPLHDVKEPDSNKEIKIVQKYDYLPQESDIQIDHDSLASPPSPSSSTLSSVLPLHDVKEPDLNKEIKIVQKYDYLPQDYTLTDYDLCAHIIIESSLRKQELVQIDGSTVLQNQLM
ncbi:uncharacterized protein LOC123409153 [Hordeum vulgare subsp. vulgare]|uniref:uncharacterized protein LOC123409153 n=1 Tax=Hordeum vulgare subsp. vulgare TaxID=112509 RepID=UPI001D1A3FA6|nr:uncharacterized protein LOC123409153 [Hordeum vulgare subsp. vulgare]